MCKKKKITSSGDCNSSKEGLDDHVVSVQESHAY